MVLYIIMYIMCMKVVSDICIIMLLHVLGVVSPGKVH